MPDVKWTPAQKNAIEGSGGSLLVSAAAGSGKTAVLAERVMHHITDVKHPVDADKLLVVTFSNAAAGEMKQRISRKLWELAEQNPGDRWLIRQQLLLDCAQISTIHSFCIRLLRGNFHILELPADFRIGDERELDVLRMQTARAVIAERYDSGDAAFFDLVELLSSTRNDIKLESAVLRLYGFVRNHPFYEEWLDKVVRTYSDNQPLEQSPWFGIIIDYAVDALNHCCGILTTALEHMQQDEQLYGAYSGAFLNDLAQIKQCRSCFEQPDWDRCRAAVNEVVFGKLGRLAGYEDEARKKLFQDLRQEVKDIIVKTLQGRLFQLSAQDYIDDMHHLTPVVSELFAITMEFDRRLTEAKLQKKMLDFGDLEHYTLRLLYDSNDGRHTVSQLAIELREQYHEILIDEYQDTNGTQEMIFRAFSKECGNRFLVGDVKQSIYRFRQARPENFLEKKVSFAPFDGVTFPAKISLSANFRTRSETTGIINFIFGMAMSPKIGEMEYGEEDALYSAGSYDYTESIPVELLITDPTLAPDEDSSVIEARIVAAEIRRLLDDRTLVQGKGGMREMQSGDICILLRSRSRMQAFMDALDRQGIRCWSDKQDGFLLSAEVAPVVSFLKVLANPLLDLELSQVLCSYLYGFSSDELAQLRLVRGESLFASLLQKADKDTVCATVVEDFNLLRREAMSRPAVGVLQLIYAVTGAEHKVLAMAQGDARRGNLRLLSEYAASYGGGGDFGGFVDYLYSLEEFECDLPSASVAAGNAVSIMSIHKSKGLEFPLVFLCDTTAQFNTMDLVSDVLMHPELGFACVLRDNRRMIQHRTTALVAMALENKRAMLSEELRILYVAMTRARERLIITATDKNLSKLRSAAGDPMEENKLSGWAARTAGCYFDWIAASLCRHPDFPQDILEMPITALPRSDGQGVLSVRIMVPPPEAEDLSEHATGGSAPSPASVQNLTKRMHWEYPYLNDTETPIKLSVSQLTKGADKKDYFFTRRPKLLTEKSLTPTERGIAAHKFMQFADFASAATDPEAEIERLTQKGFLSAEEGRFVERDTLRRFFASGIGKRVLRADTVYREIRFMQEFTPDELAAINPAFAVQGNTVVQGVADCVIIENGNGVVVDYKTDMVTDIRQLAESYSPQLALYQNILEQLLEVKISERILYSFALGKEIQV